MLLYVSWTFELKQTRVYHMTQTALILKTPVTQDDNFTKPPHNMNSATYLPHCQNLRQYLQHFQSCQESSD